MVIQNIFKIIILLIMILLSCFILYNCNKTENFDNLVSANNSVEECSIYYVDYIDPNNTDQTIVNPVPLCDGTDTDFQGIPLYNLSLYQLNTMLSNERNSQKQAKINKVITDLTSNNNGVPKLPNGMCKLNAYNWVKPKIVANSPDNINNPSYLPFNINMRNLDNRGDKQDWALCYKQTNNNPDLISQNMENISNNQIKHYQSSTVSNSLFNDGNNYSKISFKNFNLNDKNNSSPTNPNLNTYMCNLDTALDINYYNNEIPANSQYLGLTIDSNNIITSIDLYTYQPDRTFLKNSSFDRIVDYASDFFRVCLTDDDGNLYNDSCQFNFNNTDYNSQYFTSISSVTDTGGSGSGSSTIPTVPKYKLAVTPISTSCKNYLFAFFNSCVPDTPTANPKLKYLDNSQPYISKIINVSFDPTSDVHFINGNNTPYGSLTAINDRIIYITNIINNRNYTHGCRKYEFNSYIDFINSYNNLFTNSIYTKVYRPNHSTTNRDTNNYNNSLIRGLTLFPTNIISDQSNKHIVLVNNIRHHYSGTNKILFQNDDAQAMNILHNYMMTGYNFKIKSCRNLTTNNNDTPQYSNVLLSFQSIENYENLFTWVKFAPVDTTLGNITFPQHHFDDFEFISQPSSNMVIYFGYLYIPQSGNYNFTLSGDNNGQSIVGIINNINDLNNINDILNNNPSQDLNTIINNQYVTIVYNKRLNYTAQLNLNAGDIKAYLIIHNSVEDLALFWNIAPSSTATGATGATGTASGSYNLITSTPFTRNSVQYYPVPIDYFILPYIDYNIHSLRMELAVLNDYINNFDTYKNNIYKRIIQSVIGSNIYSILPDSNITVATSSSASSSSPAFTAYTDINYGGTAFDVTPNTYPKYYQLNRGTIGDTNIPDNSIKSIRIYNGTSVTLYQHPGKQGVTNTYTTDVPRLPFGLYADVSEIQVNHITRHTPTTAGGTSTPRSTSPSTIYVSNKNNTHIAFISKI